MNKEYTQNFGLQWNKHAKLQLDKFSGRTLSRDRFYRESGWTREELKGKKVLEAGCGAGRFTQIVLDAGAIVYAFDSSDSVYANEKNNKHKNLHILKSDIMDLPFEENSFDYVFCFGVLQHTKNPRESFEKLVKYLKPTGKIAIDVYPLFWKTFFLSRYYLRPFTKGKDPEKLCNFIKNYWVPFWLPISEVVRKIPLVGPKLRNVVPVENIRGIFSDYDYKRFKEWAILNTFDWLSPRYDKPQKLSTVTKWFKDSNLKNIKVVLDRNIIMGVGEK